VRRIAAARRRLARARARAELTGSSTAGAAVGLGEAADQTSPADVVPAGVR
jgi:hypothetical protein